MQPTCDLSCAAERELTPPPPEGRASELTRQGSQLFQPCLNQDVGIGF